MAPQFRSRGIGYLRLGDDMSQYGSAFLSVDAGATFLDHGATSIVADDEGGGGGAAQGPGGFRSTFPPAPALSTTTVGTGATVCTTCICVFKCYMHTVRTVSICVPLYASPHVFMRAVDHLYVLFACMYRR